MRFKESIYSSGLAILSSQTLNDIYRSLFHGIQHSLNIESGSIFMKYQDRIERVFVSSNESNRVDPSSSSTIMHVLKTKQLSIIPIELFRKKHIDFPLNSIHSIFVIPIIYNQHSIGALTLRSYNHSDDLAEHTDEVTALTTWAGIGIYKALEFQKTIDQLKNRDLFLSLAAHELKTPITSINIYCELLNRQLSNHEKNKKVIESIKLEVNRLTMLISEFLGVKNKQAFIISKKPCDICQLINRTLSIISTTYPNFRFSLQLPCEDTKVYTYGDFNKLMQVLLNILTNAAKFSPLHSTIIINLTTSQKLVVISIVDKGVGIKKQDLQKIFERFYKGNNANNSEGMGLGLYLAKNIIDEHNGTIMIHSKRRYGTTVEIHLPTYDVSESRTSMELSQNS